MSNGHDQLFKDLIRAFPADLVTLMAPEIARKIDLSRLEFRPEEHFLDIPKGRQRRLDLVALARARPGIREPPVILHVEAELEYRVVVPPRLWRYNKLVSIRHGLAVHTFVIYLHGGPPGVAKCVERARSLGQPLGSFRYRSFGLSRASASEYLKKPQPLAWALAALMKPPSRRRLDLRLRCLRRIAAAKGVNEVQRFLLFNCVSTYLQLDGRAAQEYEALLAEHGNLEVRAMEMTWADKMIERGRQEGLESMRNLIVRQLQRRFKELPASILGRISSIRSTEKLAAVGDQVLEVDSLEELDLD
jgi:Domain of unknown function (DUF4351)